MYHLTTHRLYILIQEQQQSIAMRDIMTEQSSTEKEITRDKIIRNIQNTLQKTDESYNLKEIENAVDTVLKTKTDCENSEKELSAKASQLLKKRKQNNATTSKNKQKDKVPLDVLLNSITKITSPSDDDAP